MLRSPCHTAHLIHGRLDGRLGCAACDLTYAPDAPELMLAALAGVPFEDPRPQLSLVPPGSEVLEAS